MITLSILLVALLAVVIVAAFITVVSGAGFIIAFGDVIVCGLIIGLIIKLFKRKKK